MLAIETRKTETFMNIPVYFEPPILDLGKISVYEFWYNYVKPKYDEKTKLCYVDTVFKTT